MCVISGVTVWIAIMSYRYYYSGRVVLRVLGCVSVFIVCIFCFLSFSCMVFVFVFSSCIVFVLSC